MAISPLASWAWRGREARVRARRRGRRRAVFTGKRVGLEGFG
jgi:hypothetical protein